MKVVGGERCDFRLCKGKGFVRERRDFRDSASGKVVGGERRDVEDCKGEMVFSGET